MYFNIFLIIRKTKNVNMVSNKLLIFICIKNIRTFIFRVNKTYNHNSIFHKKFLDMIQ